MEWREWKGGTCHNDKPGLRRLRPLPRAGGAWRAGGGVEDLDAAGEGEGLFPMILPLCLPLPSP